MINTLKKFNNELNNIAKDVKAGKELTELELIYLERIKIRAEILINN